MMFRPRESYDQRMLSERLVITPEPVSLRFVHDVFGNCVGVARFAGAAEELTFESTVELDHRPPPLADEDDAADPCRPLSGRLRRRGRARPAALHPAQASRPERGPEPLGASGSCAADGPTGLLDLLSAMTHAIHDEFSYVCAPGSRHADARCRPCAAAPAPAGTSPC